MSRIIVGNCMDVLQTLDAESVQACITSPPYWGLRDYGVDDQLGLERVHDCLGWATGEPCGECYVCHTVAWAREVRPVLRDDGVLWVVIGDSYASGKGTCYNPGGGENSLGQNRKALGAHPLDRGNKSELEASGLKPKDLVGIPWRVALALQADGWWLRSDVVWAKPNPMPESVTDRPTKAHEYIFLFAKSAKYYWDQDAVREPAVYYSAFKAPGNKHSGPVDAENPLSRNGTGQYDGYYAGRENEIIPTGANGRNIRTVWTVATKPYSGAHFATFPTTLVETMIKASTKEGDTVLDPFTGAGTTGLVADRLGRAFVGIELNPEYAEMARRRIVADAPLLASTPMLEGRPQNE